jgi:two-component system nitrate/nitrite sensor histidine kinase NarX
MARQPPVIADRTHDVLRSGQTGVPLGSAADALWRALLDTSADAILVADREGTIVLANARSAALFGYESSAALLGQSIFARLDDGLDRERVTALRSALGQQTGIHNSERWLRNRDGTRIPVEVSASVIGESGDGPLWLLFMVRDIAERKQREAQYDAVLAAMGDGLVIYTMEGVMVEANPAFCAMNGFTREELLGQNVTMLIHPDFHPLFRQFVETIARGGSLYARATNVRKDGTSFPVDVHGAVVLFEGAPHILGVARDVTELVRAYDLLEQRVAERTHELATLLEVSHTVAAILDLGPLLELILDQLRMVMDYQGAALLGLEDHHLVVLARRPGGPDPAVGPASVPLSTLEPIWETLRSGETLIVDDVLGEDPLGRAYSMAVAGHPELSFRGERSWLAVPLVIQERTIGALTLAHDQPGYYTAHHAQLARAIATQAAIAIANARLYTQAQQAAALDERQRLARELHDAVTQTLFSASLMAEMLPKLWTRDPQAGLQRLDDVRALTRGALAEMRTLLLELRPTALVEAPLGDLLRQLGEVLAGRARIPVQVVSEGDGRLPAEVQVAVYRIAQEALHNVDKHAQAAHVAVRLRCSSQAVDLWISDDGCGFDPQAHRAAHFGLANMRERARALGATLRVRSRPGAGTALHLHWTAPPAREGP